MKPCRSGYAVAQASLKRTPAMVSWAAYAAGAFLVLMRERGAHFMGGARILIQSAVPEGKGVSSSAAIEWPSWRRLPQPMT